MRIDVFIDDEPQPRQSFSPPSTFDLDTSDLPDGPHLLTIRATDENGTVGVQEIRFTVRNGPGIAVVGLRSGEIVRGHVPVIVNAFASRPGDPFEPVRAETPAPIPTWAWVLFLGVVAWGMWYVATELMSHGKVVSLTTPAAAAAPAGAHPSPATLGEQVFGNKCSPCHQLSGMGVTGVFPPLKGDPVVTAADPSEHIRTVLHGLSGKEIGGVRYSSPMPPFESQLTDEEVAAVLNHERSSWGHKATLVQPSDVAAVRTAK